MLLSVNKIIIQHPKSGTNEIKLGESVSSLNKKIEKISKISPAEERIFLNINLKFEKL